MLLSDSLLSSLFLLSYVFPSAHSAFTYQFGVPGSCDDLEISWTGPPPSDPNLTFDSLLTTGGQGPFELILVPVRPSVPCHC